MQSSSQIVTYNILTLTYLQARCPSCRPNSIWALNGESITPWTCSSQAHLYHSTDLFTPNLPGRLSSLSSPSKRLHNCWNFMCRVPVITDVTRGYSYKLYISNHFFSRRVIHCWNTLPACDEDFSCLSSFIRLLYRSVLSRFTLRSARSVFMFLFFYVYRSALCDALLSGV